MPRRNKGIHIKFRKERNYWEVGEYINGQFKRYRTGIESSQEAERQLVEVINRREKPQISDNQIKLGHLVSYYIEEHLPTLSSPKTALNCFERLLPFWGELNLFQIRKSKSLDYIKYRKQEFVNWQKGQNFKTLRNLSGQTIRRELEQLQAAIRYCYEDNLISICPFVWKPKKGQPRDRWMTKKEAASLLLAARKNQRSPYLELYIVIGLYTGARSNAIRSLKWSDVNFETNIINFKKQGETANKKKSVIPMPRRLSRALKKAKRFSNGTGFVIHINREKIKSVKTSLTSAYKNAGIEKVTSHTLRHTAASWMVQKGVPLAEVAMYLGTTVQVIQETYGHMEPEHLKKAIESFG